MRGAHPHGAFAQACHRGQPGGDPQLVSAGGLQGHIVPADTHHQAGGTGQEGPQAAGQGINPIGNQDLIRACRKPCQAFAAMGITEFQPIQAHLPEIETGVDPPVRSRTARTADHRGIHQAHSHPTGLLQHLTALLEYAPHQQPQPALTVAKAVEQCHIRQLGDPLQGSPNPDQAQRPVTDGIRQD